MLTFICFLPIKFYFKFLDLKIKKIYVKDFFISTKVRPKRMEHLLRKEFFSCELYFSWLQQFFVEHTNIWFQIQKDWALIPLFAIFATKQRYHLPLPVSPVDFLVCSTHLDSLIAWHKFKNPFQLFASLIHFQQNVISAIHSEKFIKDRRKISAS